MVTDIISDKQTLACLYFQLQPSTLNIYHNPERNFNQKKDSDLHCTHTVTPTIINNAWGPFPIYEKPNNEYIVSKRGFPGS